jgi:hypothetical protein
LRRAGNLVSRWLPMGRLKPCWKQATCCKGSKLGLQATAAQGQAAYGNPVEAWQTAAEALKLAPASQGVEVEATLAFCHGGRYGTSRVVGSRFGKRCPLDTQTQSLWLPAIQAQLALDRKNPSAALSAAQSVSPSSLGQLSSSPIFPASIMCTYAERHTWQPNRATLPPPSFRRFSTTAASSGIAGRSHWRILDWLVPTPRNREPRREQMPMPPAG